MPLQPSITEIYRYTYQNTETAGTCQCVIKNLILKIYSGMVKFVVLQDQHHQHRTPRPFSFTPLLVRKNPEKQDGGGGVGGKKERKKFSFSFVYPIERHLDSIKNMRQMHGIHSQLSISSEDLDRIWSRQRQSIPIFGIFLCIWRPVSSNQQQDPLMRCSPLHLEGDVGKGEMMVLQ